MVLYERIIEDTKEKVEIFRLEILGRFDARDDFLEYDINTFDGVTLFPWDTTLFLEKIERCTIKVTSTSLGID